MDRPEMPLPAKPRELPRWRSTDERAFDPKRRPLPPDVVAELQARREKGSRSSSDSRRGFVDVFQDTPLKQRSLLLAAAIAVVVSVPAAAFFVGRATAPAVERKTPQARPAWDAESLAQLDGALGKLRNKDAAGAVKTLTALRNTHGDLPSLAYALALAMMQNGENASSLLEHCVATGDHASDALALQAALGFGNKRTMLEQAIAADPMNPSPFIELANISRKGLETKKALALLNSAQQRLLPVDSWLSIPVTAELVRLAALTDDELPPVDPSASQPAPLFASAYTALRKGDHDTAAVLLTRARETMDPATFVYLTSDPAFVAFHAEPKMQGLLR